MKTESRRLLHLGINLLMAPAAEMAREDFWRFQSQVFAAGIDYEQAQRPNENTVLLTRTGPPMLQIQVMRALDSSIQLLMSATEPGLIVSVFKNEIAAIRDAYVKTWSHTQQVFGCDVLMRCLYEADGDHAFQELWETTLQQKAVALSTFGRPILGGGIRFVMPNTGGNAADASVEVRIESFLRDTQKMFVETQFAWQMPPQVEILDFDLAERIEQVDAFVKTEVVSFIQGRRL